MMTESPNMAPPDDKTLKLILQGGLAAVGAFLVVVMAWQQNGAIQMIQRELAAHSAATQPLRDEISALKWQIERQTEIQRQMCVMQARSQRLSTDVCWQVPSR